MLIRIAQFFLFTSLYIAGCALLMVHQTNQLFALHYDHKSYFAFVFFATLCSYNFHWYLTPDMPAETIRIGWTQRHKTLHLALFMLGAIVAGWYFLPFLGSWYWLCGAIFLTFLYSAPKIPAKAARRLQKIAIGKTLFLTFVWTYVTSVLPVALDGHHWNQQSLFFILSRFLLIYAICILFDYRDRSYDKQQGIRSLITIFTDKGVDRLFYGTLAAFAIITAALYDAHFSLALIGLLLIPGIIVWILYPYAKKNFSDYLYYFVLDGLMMLSALLTTLLPIH